MYFLINVLGYVLASYCVAQNFGRRFVDQQFFFDFLRTNFSDCKDWFFLLAINACDFHGVTINLN